MAMDKMGGFSQPGARSTRNETPQTEVAMPLLQALVRSGADMAAALLGLGALAVLGRWVIWAVVAAFCFSQY